MGKSISEMYDEMRGIKKPVVVVEAKPVIPLPEFIEHKNDPIVAMFLEQTKKTAAQQDKVKLGVKTPVDLEPTTTPQLPSDVEAIPKVNKFKAPVKDEVMSAAVQTIKGKKRKKTTVKESLLGGIAATGIGVLAGVGSALVGGRHPVRSGIRAGRATKRFIDRSPKTSRIAATATQHFNTAVGYHNLGVQAWSKHDDLMAKHYMKKRDSYLDRYATHELNNPDKNREHSKSIEDNIRRLRGSFDWTRNVNRTWNESTMTEVKEINPQVKYGGPWQDSVKAISGMNLDIGTMQVKRLQATGKNREFLEKAIIKAKKARDKAIEVHKGKFPIRVNESNDKFITGMGGDLTMTDHTGKVVGKLAKYGVWAHDKAKGKHQVIDTGDDLKALQKKHGVPNDRVRNINEAHKFVPRSNDAGFKVGERVRWKPPGQKFTDKHQSGVVIGISTDKKGKKHLQIRTANGKTITRIPRQTSHKTNNSLIEETIQEGQMKKWLMDMEYHVHELSAKHKGDRAKAKSDFLKKYPGQHEVFRNTWGTTSGDYPIPGWKPSKLRKETLERIQESIGNQPPTEAKKERIMDRLALFGFFPFGDWPTPEERAQLSESVGPGAPFKLSNTKKTKKDGKKKLGNLIVMAAGKVARRTRNDK